MFPFVVLLEDMKATWTPEKAKKTKTIVPMNSPRPATIWPRELGGSLSNSAPNNRLRGSAFERVVGVVCIFIVGTWVTLIEIERLSVDILGAEKV